MHVQATSAPRAAAPSEPNQTSSKKDERRLIKSGTPGIYKRVKPSGTVCDYVVTYRAAGKQRKEYAATLAAARALKRARETDRDRGEFQERSTIGFREYLRDWIGCYMGSGGRGFREGTREEYRRLLDQYAHGFFPEKLRLVDVTPRHLGQFVAWLADEKKQGKLLADATISNIVIPLKAALSTARREGLIRHNPSTGLSLPRRERVEENEDEIKALSREQLRLLVAMAPDRSCVLVEVVASTGLRISEAIGLQRKHVRLDGERPHVRVRRAVVKRRVEAPKTRHGRRDVPIASSLALKLRGHLASLEDKSQEALLFPSERGTFLDPDNLRKRMLKPLVEEIGAPWAGWHTLRHTYASLQLAAGANMLQLSRALGHHSPAFTLDRYCHLLAGDEAPPLDLAPAPRVARFPSAV